MDTAEIKAFLLAQEDVSLYPAKHWAKLCECSRGRISGYIAELGLKPYHYVSKNHKNYEAIKADPRLSLDSRPVLAKRHDCCVSTISRARIELGIPTVKYAAYRPQGMIYKKIESGIAKNAGLFKVWTRPNGIDALLEQINE
jgi:hypothetical protein